MIDFAVPDLGEGLEDATVSQWQVAVGDQVELNQVLCTVETAKAAVEIPSPVAGRVVELGGAEGDVLPVGAILVRFDPAPSSGGVLVGYGTDAEADRSRRPPQSQRPRTRPSVRKLAAELQVDLNAVAPAENGIITREAVLATA
ncbi:biotin/lipoyl-containing protein, partial [Mycolicibacterium insubricum]